MKYVAYNYFETPKKFRGGLNELHGIIKDSRGLTNYSFIKSRKEKIEVTIELHNDPRWEHSTFSVSGSNRETVEAFCLSLKESVNSYLCISGTLGQGSNQEWSFLYKSSACPQSLLEQVSNA